MLGCGDDEGMSTRGDGIRGDGDGRASWAGRYRAVRHALDAIPPVRPEVVAALRLIPALREELDGIEREVIDAARRSGASWTEIASALGLRSRQAAEQRRLRLGAGAGRDAAEARQRRRRQRSVDRVAGERAVALRAAVEDLVTVLDREVPAPAGPPTLGLARRTLRIASEADPGASCQNGGRRGGANRRLSNWRKKESRGTIARRAASGPLNIGDDLSYGVPGRMTAVWHGACFSDEASVERR